MEQIGERVSAAAPGQETPGQQDSLDQKTTYSGARSQDRMRGDVSKQMPRLSLVLTFAAAGLVLILAAGVAWGPGPAVLGLVCLLLGAGGARRLVRASDRPAGVTPPPLPSTRADGARLRTVEALVCTLPEPTLLLTCAGDILIANSRVELMLGPSRVGDPLSFVVRVPEVLDAVRGCARDGISRRVEFGARIPLDRWLEAHVAPLRLDPDVAGARSTPDAVLLTFRDLTQQRRVERMRADFVANASHELRTPLASLSGFIETLQGPARNDSAARERFLAIMAAQARRMSRLVEDLLSLSRIELNTHVRPSASVDLGAIVGHVCETLGPLARERGVELGLQSPSEPLMVRGDRDELIRLFENLVENALKYGADGQRVEVVLVRERERQVDCVRVSVRDFGPGISAEHLPRLTERFYRVDVAASREQGGTGLGLAIVKHIVARHRGRLAIESRPGEGAVFTVRLDVEA